jgi:hypothetical protein
MSFAVLQVVSACFNFSTLQKNPRGFAMLIATLVLLFLVLRALYLRAWLGNSAPIRTERKGWLTCEVWRRVGMEKIPGYVSEFPVPREERIRVFRLLGMVLWHTEMSVALPDTACESLEKIAPADFDRQFPSWLRLATNSGFNS